jgi:hypothetical protein
MTFILNSARLLPAADRRDATPVEAAKQTPMLSKAGWRANLNPQFGRRWRPDFDVLATRACHLIQAEGEPRNNHT